MQITLNDTLLRFLIEESRHRYTRCEAFENLYTMIMDAEDGIISTSCNRLAKAWHWDNHTVLSFLEDLERIDVIAMERDAMSVTLTFTEEFEDKTERLAPFFSLLSMKQRKADKAEAFFRVLNRVMTQKTDDTAGISSRSLAKELGWSHHTAAGLLKIMEKNGIIRLHSPTDSRA